MLPKRGSIIVLEGLDRVGKTLQSTKLVQWFRDQSQACELIRFPDRSTVTGQIINQYLIGKTKLNDQVVHLLFTANRWEKYDQMLELVSSGTNLVIDRYSYSGVAYTSAKGLDFEWCRSPERGLIKPDCVIYLTGSVDEMQNRGEYGREVYENTTFQKLVEEKYQQMTDQNWMTINANQSIDQVHQQIIELIKKKLEALPEKIERLW